MSKLQAWREIRSKWATANIALVALETAVMNFRWSYPTQRLPESHDDLLENLTDLLAASRKVGYITQDVRDDIMAEEE